MRAQISAGRFLSGPLYRQIVLRLHAAALASPHDGEGQVRWTRSDSWQLFADNTPHRSYVRRAAAAFSADYRDRLGDVAVPTLILTPSHDELIGPRAAQTLRDGIPDATETVVERTGHMFRFTHPQTYAAAIRAFLATRSLSPLPAQVAHH